MKLSDNILISQQKETGFTALKARCRLKRLPRSFFFFLVLTTITAVSSSLSVASLNSDMELHWGLKPIRRRWELEYMYFFKSSQSPLLHSSSSSFMRLIFA
jgi:hypothetical protein